MKNIWRAIRVILEIAIACIIFFFIITKTPLFERAIPDLDNNKVSTGTLIVDQYTTRDKTSIITNSWILYTPTQFSGVTQIIESNGNIVYLYDDDAISKTTSWALIDTTLYPASRVIEVPVQQANSCTTPRWEIINDKNTIIAYQSQRANNNNTCWAEIRICTNGKLSWSYTYSTCNYEINGTIIWADGTKIETISWSTNNSQQYIDLSKYIKQKESIPDKYIQPVIVRDNSTPTLSEVKSQSMNNSTIKEHTTYGDSLDQTTVRDSPATTYYRSCITPRWEKVNHGDFIYAYNISQSSLLQQCISQKRSCIDGKLSWSFQYQSCKIIGERIGIVKDYYGNIVQRGLQNSNTNNSQNYLSTTVENSSCTTPRWQEISHTSSVIAYRLPTSTDNSLCDKEVRVCRNWVLHGSYTYQTCMEKPNNTSWRNRNRWNNIWN